MPQAQRSKRPWLVCLLVLSVGIAANFESVWRAPSLQKLLGAGDSHWYFGPQAAFMDRAIARGEMPQWSPLSFCGQPFAANPQTQVLYPLNLARSVLTRDPTPRRTHIGAAILSALHLLITGLGTFALARTHGLTTGASLVSAWGFGFSASLVRRVVGNQFLGVVAWVPWILLALHRRADDEPAAGQVRRTLVAGCLFGLSVLGGFPQLSIYIGLGLAAYVLAQGMNRRPRLAPGPLCRDGAQVALVALTGALVAAPMLLPAAEFIARSTRLDPTLAQTGSMARVSQYTGLRDLFEALATYPGTRGFRVNYRACGAGILILALVGLSHPRRRSVVVLAALFLVFLDCSLGPPWPLSALLSKTISSPLINPSRGFILACLPLALLAGFGVDASRVEPSRRTVRVLRTGLVLALGLTVLTILGRGLGSPMFLGLARGVVVIPALLCCALIAKLWWRAPWSALILLLVGAETVTWNHRFVPHMIQARGFEGDTAGLANPRQLPLDNRRFSVERASEAAYELRPTINGYDPLQLAISRRVLCGPTNEGAYDRKLEQAEVMSENQRGNLFLKRPFWLARQFVRGPLPGKRELFPVATTTFLESSKALHVPAVDRHSLAPSSVSRRARPRRVAGPEELIWTRGRSGRRWRLVLPEFRLPRAHSALLLEYLSTEAAEISVEFLGPERSEPGYTLSLPATAMESKVVEVPLADLASMRVLLTTPLGTAPPRVLEALVLSDVADEDGRIHIRDWGANSVTVQVGPLESHRLLTFVDAAYPGWSATVDGEPVPLYLAADAFKAVEVPPGTHEVRFSFRSRRMWLGLGISLATLALCALLLWRTRGSARPGTSGT